MTLSQPITAFRSSWVRLSTTSERVFSVDIHQLGGNRASLLISEVQLTDRDPLSDRELADLAAAESEILEGRFTAIPEDASDEDLFRSLDSD